MALTKVDISMLEDAGVSGQVLTSDGTNWTSAVAAGGGDTRNFIIDGDMTQWPEGTGATTTVNNKYSSALIKMAFSHDGATTWERSTDVPTASTTVPEFEYSHLTKCTGTDASIASGQHMLLRYHITGSDFKYLHKKQVTFSFWAKTAAANSGDTVSVGLNNSAYNRGYVFTFTPTSTWTKFTETITMDASGTWLFTEADLGLSVVFVLAVGSTYQASSDDTWEGSNVWGSSSNSNFMDNTSNEFYITGLSVVLGSSAPSLFLGDSISKTRDQVLYYVEMLPGDAGDTTNGGFFANGHCDSANVLRAMLIYRPKRVVPTISSVSTTAAHYSVRSVGQYAMTQVPEYSTTMKSNSRANFTSTGNYTSGRGGYAFSSNEAGLILINARH